VEAFTGVAREHEDTDVSVLRTDLPLLRKHLVGRLDACTASIGALRPLLPDDEPDGAPHDVLPPGCEQVWTRRAAMQPWEFDILLAPGSTEGGCTSATSQWQCRCATPLWEPDGIRYLQPEIQLL